MFDKLEVVEARYEELTKLISDPDVIANQAEWQKLIKEHSSIEEVVQKYREYKKTKQNKMRSKVALTVAAQRIKDGKPMSNVAVLNAVGEMRQQFAVETTDQTFDRVKDTKKPTKAQLAIVKKFGEHRM